VWAMQGTTTFLTLSSLDDLPHKVGGVNAGERQGVAGLAPSRGWPY
jgi:hypothetical protein